MEQIDAHRCFDGQPLRVRHRAGTLNCDMTFSIYLPPQADQRAVPALYWLSGLTCTDENFVLKAGAQRYAAKYGIALIAPDTSPRGEGVPDDPAGAYDFGLGAGFYLNATRHPWDKHYRMYDYVAEELPHLINEHFPVDREKIALSGHSMGGHGALTIALKNPDRYRSVSAFAPICSPMRCPWGEKALGTYLGNDRESWRNYDSSQLIKQAPLHLPILIDQGEADDFLDSQLKPHLLAEAAQEVGYPLDIRYRPGYDHSYFFISSFIGDHLRFHARHL